MILDRGLNQGLSDPDTDAIPMCQHASLQHFFVYFKAHAFSATFQKAGSPNSTIIFRIAQVNYAMSCWLTVELGHL